MKFYTIMPFVPSDTAFMAEEYKRFHKASGLDLLLPSMTLHPEGGDPYEKADFFIDAFADLKKKLAGSGIRLGILLQALIGHGWSSSRPSGRFQVTINHTGDTRGRICPLDPGFREYCRYTVSSLAKLGPVTFLLDDDTRLLDNDKLECFCPLHLEKYSKHYERDELIRLVLAAKPGDAILKEFESIRRKTLENFCAGIRQAIDSVDPSIPCGISGPGREQIMFERMALAAAGKTEPFVRVGNALYFESSAKDLPRRIWQTAVQIKGCGKVKMILDESDTFPQNRYSKSVSGMHTHITAGILHGLRGSKMWIENFGNVKAGLPNVFFEKQMKKYGGFYEELTRTVEKVQWKGAAIPLPDLEKNFHPKEYPDYFTGKEWFSDVLGRLGIPVTFRDAADPDAECFLLTGAMIKHLTERDLKSVMTKNIFADAGAAEYLIERGYGKQLGVRIEECPHFSSERDLTTGLNMRLLFNPDCRKLVPAKGAEVLSMLNKIPFSGSPDRREIAPGSTLYDHGSGKAAVWAGVPDVYTVSPERKRWLLHILKQLAEIPAACLNEQDIMFRCGILPGGALLAAVIDLCYDELTDIRLCCAKKPRKIEVLTPAGKWRMVEFTFENNTLRLEKLKCGAYQPLILKIS